MGQRTVDRIGSLLATAISVAVVLIVMAVLGAPGWALVGCGAIMWMVTLHA